MHSAEMMQIEGREQQIISLNNLLSYFEKHCTLFANTFLENANKIKQVKEREGRGEKIVNIHNPAT